MLGNQPRRHVLDVKDVVLLLKETFTSLIPFFLIPPILGFGMINCLYELLDGMGIKIKKDKKLKCWLYTSLILFLLAFLIRAFSSTKI